jgi:DNA-binding CsgD family transcriptional regulator/tetratricopeptide (TPR) repeat protein
MVAREREFAALCAALERTHQGHTQAVAVAGEAGIGKSRLVAEFRHHAEGRGVEVLAGGCLPFGAQALPYAPLAEALRGLLHRRGAREVRRYAGDNAARLAALAPALAGGGRVEQAAGPMLLESLLAFLGELSREQPVVLILEDVHWASPPVLEATAFLCRNLRGPVMVALTLRDDELRPDRPLGRLLDMLYRHPGGLILELDRLDREATARQALAITGESLSPGRLDAVHARSEGVPLYVEELLASGANGSGRAMPRSLTSILLARLPELSADARSLLEVAAVGAPAAGRQLAALAGLSGTRATRALLALERAQLLLPDPDDGVEGRVRFRHSLIQEAAYGTVSPSRRVALHASMAEAMERSPLPEAAGRSAAHWEGARQPARAAEAHVRAAEAAMRSYAFAEAKAHFERALAQEQVRTDRSELLMRAAEATGAAGYPLAAAALLARIIDGKDAADPEMVDRARVRRLHWLWTAGDETTAMRIRSELLAEGASTSSAELLAARAQALMTASRFDDVPNAARAALRAARAAGDVEAEALALSAWGVALTFRGRVDAGLRRLREASDRALDAGAPILAERITGNLIASLAEAERDEELLEAAERWRRLAADRRLPPRRQAAFDAEVAATLLQLGRVEQARGLLETGDDARPDKEAAALLLARAQLRLLDGELSACAVELQRVRRLARDIHQSGMVGPMYALDAERALWSDNPEEGLAISLRGMGEVAASRQEGDYHLLAALAMRAAAAVVERASTRRRRRDVRSARTSAATVLLGLRARARAKDPRHTLTANLICAAQAHARAELATIQRRPADVAWSAAADLWEVSRRPALAGYARMRQAEALLAARRRIDGMHAIAQAAELAVESGSRPLLMAVESTRARAGGTMADELQQLTGREQAVLQLIADGHTNRQIADRLFISEKTVAVHVSNVLGKLGASTRGEAAARMLRAKAASG